MFWGLFCLVAAGLAYVRLAPTDVSKWHPIETQVRAVGDYPALGQFLAVRAGDTSALARIDAVARAWPRTRLVAGQVQDGQITFVTRSRLIGFPDYTTVSLDGGQIQIFARLRFGLRDFGVNEARVRAWLKETGIS